MVGKWRWLCLALREPKAFRGRDGSRCWQTGANPDFISLLLLNCGHIQQAGLCSVSCNLLSAFDGQPCWFRPLNWALPYASPFLRAVYTGSVKSWRRDLSHVPVHKQMLSTRIFLARCYACSISTGSFSVICTENLFAIQSKHNKGN